MYMKMYINVYKCTFLCDLFELQSPAGSLTTSAKIGHSIRPSLFPQRIIHLAIHTFQLRVAWAMRVPLVPSKRDPVKGALQLHETTTREAKKPICGLDAGRTLARIHILLERGQQNRVKRMFKRLHNKRACTTCSSS